ncbi:hypothetical protein P153DRAFT_376043 [Dothidotthia symphoricarpi CBS 119687]|uniref:Rhodopsin domain-containing protein n=1 Tax=Dothidotthia symphoricarpi CBS 119687 TaxID=1392245 RepID=A0A6A6AE93_9PLEO|nr:uncharacterized protein P153DRAFT_376043 [Dothidotthia symphoricarpi CBS 119687]KAF2129613.1 hypothetical protein P153DRAFT_376043 [Dothidotthia symphoricarpi CBS 119687]
MVENRGPELQVVVSTFVAVAFIAVVLRVYVRLFLVKAFGWDDSWMVAALLAQIMFAAAALGGVHYGTGRHMADLTAENAMKAMRYWWICYIGYCLSMIAAKISIGLFLLRVTVSKIHRWIIFIAMGLSVLTGLTFFFVTLFQCSPISFFWNQNQPGSCVPTDVIIALTFLYSAVAIITDFTFAILPFFLIMGLNMSMNMKVMLIPILGMACIASVAVVVRLAYVMDFKNPDFLWATLDIAIWSDIEQGLAITAGSLATLRPLYRIVSSTLGFATTQPGQQSKSNMNLKSPQWDSGMPDASRRKKGPFSFSSTLMRTERGQTMQDKDEEYTMGSLAPIRLRDDLIDEETNEKGFNAWEIRAGKSADEDALIKGKITMQKQVYQQSDQL